MKICSSKGFSLIEVTFALGVASFTFITILGLLPLGLNMQKATAEQTAATNVATAIAADIHQAGTVDAMAYNSAITAISPRYSIDVTKASKVIYLDLYGNVTIKATAHYVATITLVVPPTGTPKVATYGSINIGWPAAATTPVDSITEFVAVDRN